jgi:NitT/TauT family transport system ATP-binding protein
MSLSIRNLRKVFPKEGGEMVAIDNFSLEVSEGEFVCILGPSGCGKTTLLRMIAGLEAPTSGDLLLNNVPITGPGSDRGMVFQEFALFPWRSVRKNIEFGLEVKNVPATERASISQRFIDLVGLNGFEDYHPNQLSGRYRQGPGQ